MRAGEPSRTAFGAATHRAVHQDLEGGVVFHDPLAWVLLGSHREQVLADARKRDRMTLRLFIAARHRFAEDMLTVAVERETDQAVVLGAGLDTFAYRNPHPGLTVWEVDHPDTGAWKRERLAAAGIDTRGVRYAGVDFERDDLLERLSASGFDATRPAFFLWLGVVPYLTRDAITATLRALGTIPGGEVVFDYPTGLAGLDARSRLGRARLAARTAAVGEPLLSTFEPSEVADLLQASGFDEVRDLGRAGILAFIGVPADPGRARRGVGGGHLVRGRRSR
jgi:methyltransferase (TIGR00027 family)